MPVRASWNATSSNTSPKAAPIADEPLEGTATLHHPPESSNAADNIATLFVAAGETTAAQDLTLFTPFTYLVTIVLRPAFVPPFSTTTGRVQPC
jgi:hypothetical protein